jgi:replicative DNA helicase
MIQVPHSIEAEEATLGAIVLDPRRIETILGRLSPEDFYHAGYSRLYRAMIDCYASGLLPDEVTLASRGVDVLLLSDLSGKVPTVHGLDGYIKILRDKASLRRFLAVLDRARADALSERQDASELISTALCAISDCYRSDMQIKCELDLLRELVTEVKAAKCGEAPAAQSGVPTGIACIDDMLVYRGLPRGLVTTVGAKTSQGKSSLAQAFKRAAASAGNRVLVITLEDSAEANTRRDVAAESRIQNMQIQRRIVGDSEMHYFAAAVEKIGKYASLIHYLDDSPDNIDELLSAATQWIAKSGTDLVIVDYLQMIPSGKAYSKEQQHTDYIFGQILKFSRRHKQAATLLVTQMARHEGRPQLHQLYHSGKLEQGSHTVMLIWHPEIKGDGWPISRPGRDGKPAVIDCRVIDIAKQKDGGIGAGIVGWDARSVRFYDPLSMDAAKYKSMIKE